MHLAKRLNEELAQQSRRDRTVGTNRATSPDEPRSRSYDQRTQTKGKIDITVPKLYLTAFTFGWRDLGSMTQTDIYWFAFIC